MPPRRVLVVDDDPSVCRALTVTLRRAGYEAARHDSGFGLAVAIRSFEPDLIILDVDMPGLAGPAAARAAAEVAGDLPPIVLCSGLGEEDLQRKAAQVGAAGIVRKPVTRQELIAAVEQVLSAPHRSVAHV